MDPLVISDYSAKKKNRKQSLFEVKQLTAVISSNEINSCMRDSEVTKLCPSPSADPGSGTPEQDREQDRQKDTSMSRSKLKGLKSRIKIFFQTPRHYS